MNKRLGDYHLRLLKSIILRHQEYMEVVLVVANTKDSFEMFEILLRAAIDKRPLQTQIEIDILYLLNSIHLNKELFIGWVHSHGSKHTDSTVNALDNS